LKNKQLQKTPITKEKIFLGSKVRLCIAMGIFEKIQCQRSKFIFSSEKLYAPLQSETHKKTF